MATEDAEETEELKTKSVWSRWWLLLSLLVLMLLSAAGVLLWLFVLGEDSSGSEESAVPAKGPLLIEDPDGVLSGAQLPLEPLVINIGSANTFLKIQVVVEYFDFQLPASVSLHVARIKDSLIRVISKKDPEMLLSDKGKTDLRVELLSEINAAIGEESPEEIVDLYFTQFVLQFE